MATDLNLSNIVSVTTTTISASGPTTNISLPLCVDMDNVLNTLPGTDPIVPQIRAYTSVAGMAADGFKPWNGAYRQAQVFFGQAAHPLEFLVASYNSALDLADFLTACEQANPAWYAFGLSDAVTSSPNDANICADWVLTTAEGKHVFVQDSYNATDATSAANLFSGWHNADNSRASGWYHVPVIGAYVQTFSRAFVTGNTATGKINGAAFSEAFDTDSNTTLANLAASYEALSSVSAAFPISVGSADNDQRAILLIAENPNQPLVMSDFAVTGGATKPTQTFGISQYTIKTLSLSGALVTGNTMAVAINGGAVQSEVFATNSLATLQALAAKLADLDTVGYAASNVQTEILVVSKTPNQRLDFTTLTVTGGSTQATPSVLTYPSVTPGYPLAMAVLGACIGAPAGTQAFSNRQLQVVAADNLTQTEYNAILANKANCYARFGANNVATRIGTCASGLTLKNRLTIDAIDLDLQAALFANAQNNTTPYTDPGIQSYVNAGSGVLKAYENSGAIAPGWTFTGPPRSAVSQQDVTDGVLRNLRYSYTTAGEIQRVIATGTATV